jgi:hypothetical protein
MTKPILYQPVIVTGFSTETVKILITLPNSVMTISNGCQKVWLKKEKSLSKKSGKN